MNKAQWKANQRWERQQFNADHPAECCYCLRRFKTERGLKRHKSYCWRNPQAQRFTQGGYDGKGEYVPLQIRNGIAHGMRFRGATALEEQKIKRDMEHVIGLLS